MLIIEIILTVFVWRKGWNWMSLIPTGLAFIIGFMLGASGSVDASSVGVIFIDVLAIIALILMLVFPPKTVTPPAPPAPPTE